MPEPDDATTEHEVKVGAPPGFALPSLDDLLDGVTVGEPAQQRLVADYYDTSDLRLTAAGSSLRYRTGDTGGDGWTVKVPAGEPTDDGSIRRTEVEVAGGPGAVPAEAAELVAASTGARGLERIVRLDTRRRTLHLLGDAGTPVIEVADDEVIVLDGERTAGMFREIEAEVVGPAPAGLLDAVVARLRAAGAGDPDPTPKVARAIRLVRPLVHAAGGVVWRPGAGGGREVLVVHRPKYDDWSLPKGKRDEGETDEACARREVEEETGLRCTLGEELAGTSYVDSKGRPKVVRYWAMTVDDGSFAPNDEVDDVRWLPVADARGLLTYGHDRAVLDDLPSA